MRIFFVRPAYEHYPSGVAVILPFAYVSYLEHQILYAYEQILDNEIYIFAHGIKHNLII